MDRMLAVVAAMMLGAIGAGATAQEAQPAPAATGIEYKLLATTKTSTMQKEMSEAAEAGFRYEGVMGGETGFGGKEIVVILSRTRALEPPEALYEYKLLATNKTSTMQKEMAEAAASGFEFRGQTVAETMFGGREAVILMERGRNAGTPTHEYKLLATNKTSTMQKEMTEAAEAGFTFRAVAVAKTAFGGNEVVCIMERKLQP